MTYRPDEPTLPGPGVPAGPSPVPPPAAAQPGRLTFSVGPEQVEQVLLALGVGLLFAAVAVSASFSRSGGHLDASNFLVGVVATLALLAAAVGAQQQVSDERRRAFLVSWTGAFGTLGVGAMITTAITNGRLSAYLGSVVVLGLSVGGYLLTRRPPFVLSGIVGVVGLWGQLYDDIVGGGNLDLTGDGGSGDNFGIKVGSAILVIVVLLTVAGWLLPTRELSGVVVGIGGLIAMDLVLVALIAIRAIAQAFSVTTTSSEFSSGFPSDGSTTTVTESAPVDSFKNDVWTILVFCVLLAVLWSVAALLSGQVGFRLLVVADIVTVVPLAVGALLVDHTTGWGIVTLVLGAAVLALVGMRALASPPTAPAAPPAAY